MSTTTSNLGLFKYDTTNPTDLASAFNINTALNANWDIIDNAISNSGGARNIGEIVASTIPLTDAGLHLLDGALISGNGAYADFVNYIASLYEDNLPQMIDVPFVQPTLTSNGAVGGTSFAVESSNTSSAGGASAARDPYRSFDGNSATKWGKNNSANGWLTFYNPRALKVSSIIYNPSTDYAGEDYGNIEISASYDNQNWTNLFSGTLVANKTQTFDVNSSDYYKYYRLSLSGGHNYAGLGNLSINAVYQIPTGLFITEQQWQQFVDQYGACGKFVYDSTNNTVRLPKITGIIEGTTDITALGDLVEAGLPSITGRLGNACLDRTIATEAFYKSGYNSGAAYSGNSYTGIGVALDASRSSSIYGNSTTVQPQTIKVLYYIVIATSTKTDIQVDIDEIATDLNGKADVDLSNVPSSKGILTESYTNGTSWYRVYSDGWCEQGGYTKAGTTINLLKPYINTNYNIAMGVCSTSSDTAPTETKISIKSTTQFKFNQAYNGYTAYNVASYEWRLAGYIR